MRSFFILSAPRSGSTLLATMLGVHRQIVMFMESFWFVAASPILMRIQRTVPVAERAEAMVRFLQGVEPLGQLETPAAKLRAIVDQSQENPDSALTRLVLEFARRTKPSAVTWGEKTPPHAFYVPDIERVFPDTRYIYLVRDPRANINSIAKPTFRDYSNDWGVAAHLYVRFNRAIEKSLGDIAPDRQMRIHYEDLVKRPREELQRCCGFLGVEFDPAMLAHERFKHNLAGLGSEMAATALTRAFVGEWKEALTPTQIRCIERFTSRVQGASRYERSKPRVPPVAYAVSLVGVHGKHLCLRLAEVLIQTVRGRPFVWSRLQLMLDRFLRRLSSRSRVLRALVTTRAQP